MSSSEEVAPFVAIGKWKYINQCTEAREQMSYNKNTLMYDLQLNITFWTNECKYVAVILG